MQEFDLIIVGAGPAGITAGIYASRRALKTVIISENIGGQIMSTTWIENYPGFTQIKAVELVQKFEDHVRHFGVDIIQELVVEVNEVEGGFVVKTTQNEYKAKAVILAFGKSPRTLDVPGEKQYTGKGVSYCATCDAPLFRNMPTAVIGGGNSAFEAAHLLSQISSKVYIIHRSDTFRAFESLVEDVRKKGVEFVMNSEVKEIKGDNFVRSIVIENNKTGERKEIQVNGVFVEIGSEVKTDLIKDLVKLDESKHVVVNEKAETFYPNSDKVRPGLFAAGDLTNVPFKQIVVSAGEGCKAALQAYNYIHGIETKGHVADWSASKK
ncbi:MAG: thioredoxin-disulfide reductase [Candidatus Aenigmatarchaeota archaeon]|nr:thioredoxin-disulfide reductase [Candidatus Aenigmarchaeota archaeon]